MRINFLTHYLFPPSDGILFFFNSYGYVARTFQNLESLSTRTGMNTFHGRTCIYEAGGYDQVIHVHVKVMLCVSYCAAQNFLDYLRTNLRGEFEDSECFTNGLAADQIDYDAQFARSNANIFSNCLCFHCLFPPFPLF